MNAENVLEIRDARIADELAAFVDEIRAVPARHPAGGQDSPPTRRLRFCETTRSLRPGRQPRSGWPPHQPRACRRRPRARSSRRRTSGTSRSTSCRLRATRPAWWTRSAPAARPRRLRLRPLGPAGRSAFRSPWSGTRGASPRPLRVRRRVGSRPVPDSDERAIEGGRDSDGDRHALIVDRDSLPALRALRPLSDGRSGWRAGSGAIFDLRSNQLRPARSTSADAAGLAILPGLARYDEVPKG